MRDELEHTNQASEYANVHFSNSVPESEGLTSRFALVPEGVYRVGFNLATQRSLARVPHIGERVLLLGERTVSLKSFLMARFPVTNLEFEKIVPEHRRAIESSADNHPVVDVTYHEAAKYCSAYGYRLPRSDEWEVAARGPNVSAPGAMKLPSPEDSNYYPSKGANEAGRYPGNSLGLFDMCGNVHEFTQSELKLPNGDFVVEVRGGSWGACRYGALAPYVCYMDPHLRSNRVGFRVCKDIS